jgi:DNA-binding NtrC family response regulator
MVIDSDPRMLRYIRSVLEDDVREIITCESAEHALDCLRSGMRPQAVLTSSALGDVQSSELVSRVRKLHPRAEVVLITHVSEYGGLLPAI